MGSNGPLATTEPTKMSRFLATEVFVESRQRALTSRLAKDAGEF